MNKKIMIFGILGIFLIAAISAGLVSHFTTVQADINVEAPITLEDTLFEFDIGTLNDGYNHYLLIKGENNLDFEVPADAVITITAVDELDAPFEVDGIGLHLAVDAGGDMHYAWDDLYNPNGDDWETWMLANADWFDWIGTEVYDDSGFESPIIDHNDNSWYTYDQVGGTWENGVMTLPGINPDPGLLAALLVVRADPGLTPGTYTVKVELNPVA